MLRVCEMDPERVSKLSWEVVSGSVASTFCTTSNLLPSFEGAATCRCWRCRKEWHGAKQERVTREGVAMAARFSEA